mgnify:CR=1 FL=1
MNLYLYLPLGSAYPPGVLLPGLIIGMTKRIYALMTEQPDRIQALRRLFPTPLQPRLRPAYSMTYFKTRH